jgi:hypothetical protein
VNLPPHSFVVDVIVRRVRMELTMVSRSRGKKNKILDSYHPARAKLVTISSNAFLFWYSLPMLDEISREVLLTAKIFQSLTLWL